MSKPRFLKLTLIFVGMMVLLWIIWAPSLPMISLRYDGQIYEGVEGASCWPQIVRFMTLCGATTVDSMTERLKDPSVSIIPIEAGDTLTVEVKAHKNPLTLSASIFATLGKAPTQTHQLATESFTSSFTIDMPRGSYFISIFGKWPEGDIQYYFKVEVN